MKSDHNDNINSGLFRYQTVAEPNFSGINNLNMTESNLKSYNDSIARKIFKVTTSMYGKVSDITVLDFGAGTGTIAKILRNKYDIKSDCVELDPILKKSLESNGFITSSKLEELQLQYDVIYTSNVLEHITNDQETIEKLKKYLKYGGCLIVYVPAFPILYSYMDKKIGHVRRYRKKDLVDKIEMGGFKVQKVTYDDAIGFFVSLMLKTFKLDRIESINSTVTLKIYDRSIYPISRILDLIGMKFIVGKNILLVASK
jgi:SAM-dependent methyltransferase